MMTVLEELERDLEEAKKKPEPMSEEEKRHLQMKMDSGELQPKETK